MDLNCAGVYQITNTVNGKVYIGSGVNIGIRWRQHKNKLRKNNHENRYLQRAWNKYKEYNFDIEILQIVENKKDLIACEQFWIDGTKCSERQNGYNIIKKADNMSGIFNPFYGKKHSKKTKRKISKASKGRKLSEESKKKMSIARSGEKNYCFGIPKTDEIKAKIAKTLKGKCAGEKHHMVKLNELQVRIIKSLTEDVKNRTIFQVEIAKYFNISKYMISKIMTNKNWTHI